jgi:hypothetical protein
MRLKANMTFAEAAKLDADRQPGELDLGKWIPLTRNTWRHGQLAANVCRILGRYLDVHQGWSLSIGDPGTKLSHRPDVLRGPDVGLVRSAREPVGRGEQGWLAIPSPRLT